jgi:hypothetical protein
MITILILVIVTGLLFIAFIATLITGLLRKKKKTVIASFVVLLSFLALASWTGFRLLKKSYDKVTGAFRPRTGEEIYTSLFGKDESGCVRVTESIDQVIPRIDPAIWLRVETCPGELRRILSQRTYDFNKVETAQWNERLPYGESINWINPQAMGDTILVFEYASESGRNIQTLWVSPDSTKVLCRDVLD